MSIEFPISIFIDWLRLEFWECLFIGLPERWAPDFFEAGLILYAIPDKVEPRYCSFVILPRFATIIELQSSTYIIVSVYTTVKVSKVEKVQESWIDVLEVQTKFISVKAAVH